MNSVNMNFELFFMVKSLVTSGIGTRYFAILVPKDCRVFITNIFMIAPTPFRSANIRAVSTTECLSTFASLSVRFDYTPRCKDFFYHVVKILTKW